MFILSYYQESSASCFIYRIFFIKGQLTFILVEAVTLLVKSQILPCKVKITIVSPSLNLGLKWLFRFPGTASI